MATITVAQPKYLRNCFGVGPSLRGGQERPDIKETASQSFGVAAPLYYDSNGTIALATASSNIVGLLAGFAMKAATGVTGDPVRYRPVLPGDIYAVNVKGNSSIVVSSLALVGDVYMFDVNTGYFVLNPDAAYDVAKVCAKVLELYDAANGYSDGDVVGDTYGRVVVQFMDTKGLQY